MYLYSNRTYQQAKSLGLLQCGSPTPTAGYFRQAEIGIQVMANSKYEYVRKFEDFSQIIPQTWIIVRVDGRNFHRFTTEHNFFKPNDQRGLDLLSIAARDVMKEFGDVILGYGYSDEFSLLLHRDTTLYKRRREKISTTVGSYFTSAYVFNWYNVFKDVELKFPPSFDARAFCVPLLQNVRDYFSWRQADCHINNLYNTAFWAILKSKDNSISPSLAHKLLKDTNSAGKNELLFSKYKINYNNEPEAFRKGTILYRDSKKINDNSDQNNNKNLESSIKLKSIDIIGDNFWTDFFIPRYSNMSADLRPETLKI